MHFSATDFHILTASTVERSRLCQNCSSYMFISSTIISTYSLLKKIQTEASKFWCTLGTDETEQTITSAW